MNLDQLRYLVEVSKNTSLSQSSKKLHITHQGLSNAIRSLEQELGLQILVRMNKGVQLTAQGKALAEETQKYLQFIATLTGRTAEKEDIFSAEYDIVCSYGTMYNVIPKIISYIYKYSPQTRCNIIEKNTTECLKDVRKDRAEIAFISLAYINKQCIEQDILADGLIFQDVLQLKISGYLNENNILRKYHSISLKNLAEYPIILEHPSELQDRSIERILCHICQPQKLIFESNKLIIDEMLADDLGVYLGVINRSLGIEPAFNNHIKPIAINDDVVIKVGYVYKSGTVFERSTDDVIAYLQKNYIK